MNAIDLCAKVCAKATGKPLAETIAANATALTNFGKLAGKLTDREKVIELLKSLKFDESDTAGVLTDCENDQTARRYWVQRYNERVGAK